LTFYTIGQRHVHIRNPNSELISACAGGENTRPLYVLKKDFEKNELIVGFEDDPLMYRKKIEVKNMNWISGQKENFPLECSVRLRHRQDLQVGTVFAKNNRLFIECVTPQKSVTPGQFAVLYKDGICLGGGEVV